MTPAGLIDRSQVIASSPTQKLIYDYSETQGFYLFTIASNSLVSMTSAAAKDWFLNTGSPNFIAPGLTCWGTKIMPAVVRHQVQSVVEGPFILDKSKLGGPDVLDP